MRIAYLDCFAGIAGDMMLGALVDAGVPSSVLEDATTELGLCASLRFDRTDRSGISAIKANVFDGAHLAEVRSTLPPTKAQASEAATSGHAETDVAHVHPHRKPSLSAADSDEADAGSHDSHGRSLTVIRELIEASSLQQEVKLLALQTFELLGRAEARIHNVPVDEIHFHEVGAVDAIVDIVAACAGIVHLGVDAWYCSAVNVGGGTVRCAHGLFPVPAPATAELLRGFPTYSAHVQKELVTPTGAALLRALQPGFGAQPAMSVEQIGYGAGTRNPASFPNVLRLSIGESHDHLGDLVAPPAKDSNQNTTATESVTVLETALDDATPQMLAYVAERALQLGALDAMLTPVFMKKGRAGTLLTVLARPQDAAVFEQLMLRETTSLGVRARQDRRVCLPREHTTVATPYGDVRIKTGRMDGEVVNANPEFEDCRNAAERTGTPLKQVQAAAMAAYVNGVQIAHDDAVTQRDAGTPNTSLAASNLAQASEEPCHGTS